MATRRHGSTPPSATARFRRREIDLGDGSKLALRTTGSIVQLDSAGEAKAEWSVDDADWPRLALRFGLQPQPTTVVPEGSRRAEPRPHDG